MKTRILTAVFAIIFSGFLSQAHAQKLLDKIDQATDKVDRVSDQADRGSKTVDKVGRLLGFGKKKNKKEKEEKDSGKIEILIANGTLSYVKKLNTLVQGISGVSESKIKFNAKESTITATFKGSTDDLLSKIQAKPGNGIKDEYITGIEDGKINIKVK